MPFLNRLQRWAAERPASISVAVGDRSLGFASLAEAAARRAARGTTAICLPNSLEALTAVVAAVAGEGRCAILDPAWPRDLRSGVLGLLAPDRVLSTTSAATTSAATAPVSTPVPLADGSPDSDFLVGLTSGTTSVPKAFTRTRASWQRSLPVSCTLFGLDGDQRTLVPGPLSSGITLYALAECLWAGSPFFTLPDHGVARILGAMERQAITRLVLVPALLRLVAERGADSEHGRKAGAALHHVVTAGAKLDPATIRAVRRWAPQAVIHEYYGASELSFVAASSLGPGEEPVTGTTVGSAFPGVDLCIVDDSGVECGPGEVGNICVDSPLVSNGYLWGDDGEAFRRFGRWATVGDRGFIDREGALHFLGRCADMMVTSGHNVYPSEVEAALRGVPGVADVLVAGLPDGRRGMKVVAAVLAAEPGAGAALAGELRAASNVGLSEAKRPRRYYRLEQLPLTSAGKLSRALLVDWIKQEDPRVGPLD